MADEELRFKREILAVAGILLLGSLFILLPFMDAIILAVATSYLLRFAHKKLNSRIKNDLLSSIIVVSGVLAALSLGIYMFINNFFEIVQGMNAMIGSFREGILNVLEVINLSASFEQNVLELINSLSDRINSELISIFAGIPSMVIDIGIYLVTSIYLYKDGPRIEKELTGIIKDLPDEEEKILRSLIRSIDSIFKGVFVTQLLVAAIIGAISGIGFYLIAQVTSPMPLIPLWALLIGLAALLPIVAAFMFYSPIGLYYLIAGEPIKGILIIGFGILVLNILSETLIRPYVGSRQMDEHPLIIFTGFIAGPLTLGLKGIVLGPLILILTKEFILSYTDLVSVE